MAEDGCAGTCCLFGMLCRKKNVRDAHAEERKRLDESTEEGAELLAARQSSWAAVEKKTAAKLQAERNVLQYAGMFPMGVSIVNEYSFGSVRFGAKAFKCGLWLMAIMFSGYFIYGGWKMLEDPADTVKVHREKVLWTDHSAVPLPFISIDGVAEGLRVSATMCDIPRGDYSSKTKTPAPMHTCDVIQRQRPIHGATCIHGPADDGKDVLSVVGTFGDPLYRYLKLSVSMPSNSTQKGASLNLVMTSRLSLYSPLWDDADPYGP
eukprot:COSAG01_NODE_13724_length_1544_cov_0.937024_1_plen_264_part_00